MASGSPPISRSSVVDAPHANELADAHATRGETDPSRQVRPGALEID
jgi:hypothetical protein